MEIQFQQSKIRYLNTLSENQQTLEQTHEVRLPDEMPEIGRVICSWGQLLLRGKEWRNGSAAVTGGVMAWTIYEPEMGGSPETVEAWIPFQMKWDIPPTQHDGIILCTGWLQGVDARSVSARKIMFRTNVHMMGQALLTEESSVYSPEPMPERLQVKTCVHTLLLPMEAGEKTVSLDETLEFPGSAPKMEKLIRFSVQPELIDRRVMADKVVFRGMSIIHVLYVGEDGKLHNWDFELPFSQYAQLDGEYGEKAAAQIWPAVTGLEMDMQENGTLEMKGGMVCQYLVYDEKELELTEDAYSPGRHLSIQNDTLRLPTMLQENRQTLHALQTIHTDAQEVIDTVFTAGYPQVLRTPQGVQVDLHGQFQVLFRDMDGNLRSERSKWEESVMLDPTWEIIPNVMLVNSGAPRAALMGSEMELRADFMLDTSSQEDVQFPMVTTVEVGDEVAMDPNRPSLILRKPGQDSLWELAKKCGSTVEKIMQVNNLNGDPSADVFLIVPVI